MWLMWCFKTVAMTSLKYNKQVNAILPVSKVGRRTSADVIHKIRRWTWQK